MSRVLVNQRVLLWALERSGLPRDVLDRKFPKLPAWVIGSAQPTIRQLEDFARTTLTPFGFMFLSEPPVERLAIPHFRTLRDDNVERPSTELLESVRAMQRRQEWMREYLTEEGHARLPFVASAHQDDDPITVAGRMRSTLGIDEDWAIRHSTWEKAFDELLSLADALGILTVVNGILGNNTHRSLNPREFRGFVLVDDYAPLVFINGADGRAAQIFTLAHELAHIWFGSSAAFDLRNLEPAQNPGERLCNRIAAEFLVPESELRVAWRESVNSVDRFQDLARRFKVSQIVVARRLLDTRLIRQQDFADFYEIYTSEERLARQNRKGGGNFFTNQDHRIGKRFGSEIVRAVTEGKLLYNEAYRLTGLRGDTFEKFASHLASGRSE